jgi:hypothetical protein
MDLLNRNRMSIKQITILLVLLCLLVSCAQNNKQATPIDTAQQQADIALRKTPNIVTQALDNLTQTALAKELKGTITLTITVTPTITTTVEVTGTVNAPPSTPTKTPTFAVNIGSVKLDRNQSIVVVAAVLVFVLCLVLLLLRRRSRRIKAKGQSPQAGGKSPKSQGALSETHGLRLIMATGGEIAVPKLPALIGRDKQKSAIVLLDDTVSAVHANLYYNQSIGKVCIEDRDSLNGLFVNEQPTRNNVLEDGVTIKLGNTKLIFRDTGFIPSDQS